MTACCRRRAAPCDDRSGPDLDRARSRRRLLDFLRNDGYDAAVLNRLGRVLFDMRDGHGAGRFWLCSDAVGDEVEAAVATFLRFGGRRRERLGKVLPKFARLSSLADYPEPARRRLAGLGLAEHVLRATKKTAFAGKLSPPAPRSSTLSNGAWGIGCTLLFLTTLTFFVVGMVVSVNWLLDALL